MMTTAFLKAFALLLTHEVGSAPDGGFNITAGDRGGATRYGISLRFLQSLGRLYDKDQDGDVDAADVRLIDVDDAQTIYLINFWDPIRGDDLPPGLALLVFDAAVHSGPGTAIRRLQQAVGAKVDGRLGPATLGQVAHTPNAAERFHDVRVCAMTDMADWAKFSRGWARRVARLPFQVEQMDAAAAEMT